MSYLVIADFHHPRLGETVKAGSPFPGRLSEDSIAKLVRAGCLAPLPVSDTPQAAAHPQAREGGDTAALFRDSDPAPMAGGDGAARGERAKPERGGRKRAAKKGGPHDSGK